MKLVRKILSSMSLLPVVRKGLRYVFVYHDIDAESKPHCSFSDYSTSLEIFQSQIDFIRSEFCVVSLDTLLSDELPSGKHYAAITFDDGFFSVKQYAHPLLTSLNIPYTCFLNKTASVLNRLWISDIVLGIFDHYARAAGMDDFVGKSVAELKASKSFNEQLHLYYGDAGFDEYQVYMNSADIKELAKEGVQFQSHSMNHSVLSLLSDELLERDIRGNKQYLNDILDAPESLFALPFGKREHYSANVVECLKNAGYQHMFTTNPVGFRSAESFAIPRIGLLNDSIFDLRFMINRSLLKSIDI